MMDGKILLEIPTNNGLYDGKLGRSMCCYLASNHGNKIFKRQAKSLLEESVNALMDTTSYTIKDGLLGLGWAIEWMSENDFIKLDVNGFLEDLDNEVYKLCVYENADNSVAVDWVDVATYIRRRVGKKRKELPFYKQLPLSECVGLVMDKLIESISSENKLVRNASHWAKIFLLLISIKDAYAENQNTTKQAIAKLLAQVDERKFDTNISPEDILIVQALKTGGKKLISNEWLHYSEKFHLKLKGKSDLTNSSIYGQNYKLLMQLDKQNKTNWKEAWNFL